MADKSIKKLYYSIGEVSDMTGLEQHVIRFWESEFDALSPRKNRAGRRIYTDADIHTLERIQRLLRDEKYTIEGARQALARAQDPESEVRLREELNELRGFLAKLLETL